MQRGVLRIMRPLMSRGLSSELAGRQTSLLPEGIGLLTLAAAYSYFAGWVYAYYFYDSFGMRLQTLELPYQYFFAYSYPVFSSWRALVAIGFFAGVCWICTRSGRGRIGFIAAFVALFPVLFVAARRTATLGALDERNHPTNTISLSFRDPACLRGLPELEKASRISDGMHLLLDTKERIIVFYQPTPIAGQTTAVYVFSIQWKDLYGTMTTLR